MNPDEWIADALTDMASSAAMRGAPKVCDILSDAALKVRRARSEGVHAEVRNVKQEDAEIILLHEHRKGRRRQQTTGLR